MSTSNRSSARRDKYGGLGDVSVSGSAANQSDKMKRSNCAPVIPTRSYNCKHRNWNCVRKSVICHAVHCCVFVAIIIGYDFLFGKAHCFFMSCGGDVADAEMSLANWVVYIVRFMLAFGWMPYIVFISGGLFFFNAYETEVECNVKPHEAPFLCFRIVTRGLYPGLVRKNVKNLLNLCTNMGLKHYVIQIATDIDFGLQLSNSKVKYIVIPSDYKTKNGSLYKARALQYCLDCSSVNLKDNDWIVHLDEETVVTANSIRGILNFATDGRYQLGQGLITYIGDRIDNWFTTLLDAWRVADDLGKQRFQLGVFHRLILEWKGSFLVCKAGAEKAVTFDHGKSGSIVEDTYFGLKASQKEYKFNFIEGNMWERSPSSMWDLLQQRKRWVLGGLPIVMSSEIALRTKFIFSVHFLAIEFTLGGIVMLVANLLFPTPFPSVLDVLDSYVMALLIFMPAYGVVYSYLLFPDRGYFGLAVTMLMTVLVSPINNILLSIIIVMSFFGSNGEFYIVKKFE